MLKITIWKLQKHRHGCWYSVPCCLCLWCHEQGCQVWRKCTLHYEVGFFRSSLVRNKPTQPMPWEILIHSSSTKEKFLLHKVVEKPGLQMEIIICLFSTFWGQVASSLGVLFNCFCSVWICQSNSLHWNLSSCELSFFFSSSVKISNVSWGWPFFSNSFDLQLVIGTVILWFVRTW